MKYDYKKLEIDLREANRIAIELTSGLDDGGTCNLDSCFLRLPRAREINVIDAIKKSGLYCRSKSKWSFYGEGYFITPTTNGQANRRCKSVELMHEHLIKCGWDSIVFYQMD